MAEGAQRPLSTQHPPNANEEIGGSDAGPYQRNADAVHTPRRGTKPTRLQPPLAQTGRSGVRVVDIYGLVKHDHGFS